MELLLEQLKAEWETTLYELKAELENSRARIGEDQYRRVAAMLDVYRQQLMADKPGDPIKRARWCSAVVEMMSFVITSELHPQK